MTEIDQALGNVLDIHIRVAAWSNVAIGHVDGDVDGGHALIDAIRHLQRQTRTNEEMLRATRLRLIDASVLYSHTDKMRAAAAVVAILSTSNAPIWLRLHRQIAPMLETMIILHQYLHKYVNAETAPDK